MRSFKYVFDRKIIPENNLSIILNVVLLLFALLLMTSCSQTVLKSYGFHKPKNLSFSEQLQLAKKYQIDKENIYSLDTGFKTFLDSLQSLQNLLDSNYQKNSITYKMNQPLIYIYFNGEHQLSFLNNCYAGGYPNLNWNSGNVLDSFPPHTTAPIDTLLKFSDLKRFLLPVQAQNHFSGDQSVIVFWNYFGGRQTSKFIKAILKNRSLSLTPVNYYFVNNDAYLSMILKD